MKSIRTKPKLNNKQKTLLAQHAGYSRWVYNLGLSLWNAAYTDGYKPNARSLREVFTNHTKPLYPWMKNLSSTGLMQRSNYSGYLSNNDQIRHYM